MSLLVSLSACIFLLYTLAVLRVYKGFSRSLKNRSKLVQKASSLQLPAVTIILPVRNEESTIRECVESIAAQDYPSSFELIIVNDHSEDRTAEIILDLKSRFEFIRPLNALATGKKQAISEAISHASSNIIVQTDADCIHERTWLKTMVGFHLRGYDLTAGPVRIKASDAFSSLQAMEMGVLVAITAASIENSSPFICNGANLVFSRDAFLKVNGYEGYMDVSGGDDVFLMKKFKNDHLSIGFCNEAGSIVTTAPSPSLASLLQQKARWAAKSGKMKNSSGNFLGMTVIAMNLLLILLVIFSIIYGKFALLLLVVFLLKAALDAMILFQSLRLTDQVKAIIYLPLFEILYPVYLVLTAFKISTGRYEWKGRAVRS